MAGTMPCPRTFSSNAATRRPRFRRTLFDDPTAEIQELTSVVKQDIATLHGKFENLSKLREAIPGNKQVKDHTNNVVNSLKTKLMTTTHDFQEVR